MLILGIESSCDETACAIVDDGKIVLANVISSQIGLHRTTQGVVPEVAARAHMSRFQQVFKQALSEANIEMDKIDAVAVTAGPGLLSSVMLGVNFAGVLALIFDKPLIPVNHVYGHLLSAGLDLEREYQFPVAVLSVSGGHNELYVLHDYQKCVLYGKSLDDAAGEAYDKCAKWMGLNYPGGPEISKLAKNGDPLKFKLSSPMLQNGYDFSFSGLKSEFRRLLSSVDIEKNRQDLAASIQHAINYVLSYKLLKMAEEHKCNELHVVGGVSANHDLRAKVVSGVQNKAVLFPSKIEYCTDNAAMIARAGFYTDKSKWLKAGDAVNLINTFKIE